MQEKGKDVGFIKNELIAQYYLTEPEDLGDEYEWKVFRKILLKQGEYHANTRDCRSISTKGD